MESRMTAGGGAGEIEQKIKRTHRHRQQCDDCRVGGWGDKEDKC